MNDTKQMTLRELQLTELDILIRFDAFCNKHGLNYTLVGGTLLGAVRHKGFIPWDDDIDLAMPRPDYEKLYSISERSGFVFDGDTDLTVIPDRGKDGMLPFLKLADLRYKISTPEAVGSDNVWIDIFPIDGYPDTVKKTKKFCKKLKWYRHLIVYNISSFKRKKGFMRIIAALFSVYARIYGKDRAYGNMNKLISKYPYSSSEYVGCAVWGMYGIGERLEKSKFEKSVKVDFEGREFSAMSNWHEYLSGIYGDYMTPKKWSHGTTAESADYGSETSSEITNE